MFGVASAAGSASTSDSATNPQAPAPGPSYPVELSAERLHGLALEAFRIGNRGRLSLCDALRMLGESRLHLDLGFPSLAAYAAAFFQLRRSETFEHVRVSRALVELTDLRAAFAGGLLGWSVVKAVTRVASLVSQSAWIDFAREHDVERTLAEARDARRHGRSTPRESSWGLPNLAQKLVLRFSRSDMEKVRTWLEAACATVAARTGVEEVPLEQAILFLCEEGGESGGGDDRREAPAQPRAQIVYQRCPDCSRARVSTRDGYVEVDSHEVERYEGSAEPLVIDGPTPPELRRRVLGREAGRCGNPRCDHAADHCHHVVFRSQGGKTGLDNEVAVCRICHALIHAGLLRVSLDANGERRWDPVGPRPGILRDIAAARAAAGGLPVEHPASMGAPVKTRGPSLADATSAKESADADSPALRSGLDVEALAQGVERLGVPLGRSRQLVGTAIATVPVAEISEATVLRRVLALL
jgi:hypothetical protein